jgi:hypothetical protein
MKSEEESGEASRVLRLPDSRQVVVATAAPGSRCLGLPYLGAGIVKPAGTAELAIRHPGRRLDGLDGIGGDAGLGDPFPEGGR